MKSFNKLVIIALVLCQGIRANAQGIAPELDTLLSETLENMVSVVNTKSLSAAIQMSDGYVWTHAKGISSDIPTDVTTDDVYLIGSVTKTITSACVLQLQEEGLLNIDDSLHQWLDTINYINPNITIRQLMQHTSGIYDILNNPAHQVALEMNRSKVWTPEEAITKFIKPALFAAGTKWSYSNTNYFLLDMIIKKATGNRFFKEFRTRFFNPLQLNTFAIPSFEPMTSPVAHVWLDTNGDGILDDAHNYFISHTALNSLGGAAGGYYSTPADCTKWMRAYMRGDVIGEEMMEEMKKTVVAAGSIPRYGLGIMNTEILGYEVWGHGGDLGYHASSWYFPELDISITVFNNDGSKTSWNLIPVVRELLKTYTNNISLSTETVKPENENLELKVFPNPFVDRIEVRIPEGLTGESIEMELKDDTGKSVRKIDAKNQSLNNDVINISGLNSLNAGVYFLNLKTGQKIFKTIKLVKI